jgi:anti-repressor protein
MNELIKINTSNPERPTVSGRDLHEMLEVETPFSKWFPRMCEYGFIEGEDYQTFLSDRSDGLPGKPRTDAQLTIPMAEEICMLQRTEKGKECRQYFIKIKEAWNTPEMIVARAHQILQARLDEAVSRVSLLESKIEEDAPATQLGYAVTAADGSILVREMAKILKQNGYDTGEQRFFETLRREGFLIKSGSDRNMPTQRALEMGLFTIKENVHVTPSGSFTTRTTMVTGKGQSYFVNRYCGKKTEEKK